MPTAADYRAQARRFRAQAGTATDQQTAQHLLFMAREYEEEAERIEKEAKGSPIALGPEGPRSSGGGVPTG